MRNWFDELREPIKRYADKNQFTMEQAIGKLIRRGLRSLEKPRKRRARGRYRGRSIIDPSVRPLLVRRKKKDAK